MHSRSVFSALPTFALPTFIVFLATMDRSDPRPDTDPAAGRGDRAPKPGAAVPADGTAQSTAHGVLHRRHALRSSGSSASSDGRDGASRKRPTGPARWRPLLAFLGVLGLGVVATFLSSRRIEPLEEADWHDLLNGEEPPEDRHEPFPGTPVEVPGPAGRLHVEDGGTGGLPVVLVHGLGGAAGQWREQLAHLRRERRALALDLRGHGRSEPSAEGEYGVSELADDVAAVLDELGLERCVLVGHSLGATVVTELATRESERVVGLVLVDPNGDQTEIPRKEREEFLRALRAEPEDEMRWYFKQVLVGGETATAERVLADLAAAPAAALVAALESSFDYSPVAALESYRGRVLSIVSDMNTLPYSLHNLLPDLPVRQVRGTSHWLMLDRPDEVNQVLDAFLARF